MVCVCQDQGCIEADEGGIQVSSSLHLLPGAVSTRSTGYARSSGAGALPRPQVTQHLERVLCHVHR